MNKKTTLLIALAISCPFITFAETHNKESAKVEETKEAQVDFKKMIDMSSEIYSAITKGPHGEVSAKTLSNSKCIAVLPNVMTGAVVIGGTHGKGLVSCLDANNKWSQPAPITLNQASIGLQAGAKSTDVVLFFQTKAAVNALKKGTFEIGADISAVAGNYDSKADTASAAGVIVYTRTEGIFAGAAINGGKIGHNRDDLSNYYGMKVDYTALIEGRELPDTSGQTEKLTKLFPIAN